MARDAGVHSNPGAEATLARRKYAQHNTSETYDRVQDALNGRVFVSVVHESRTASFEVAAIGCSLERVATAGDGAVDTELVGTFFSSRKTCVGLRRSYRNRRPVHVDVCTGLDSNISPETDRTHGREPAGGGRVADDVEERVVLGLGGRSVVQSAVVLAEGSFYIEAPATETTARAGAAEAGADLLIAVLKCCVVAVNGQRTAAVALTLR